jgi:hypothetical protein
MLISDVISSKLIHRLCHIAQAVSRWLPTAAARVRAHAQHVGFVVDKVALTQIFSEYFGFACQSSFHDILHHHNHPGLAKYAYWWRRSNDWTQLESPPPTIRIKKKS